MADAGYKIFLADNPAQATEKIRDREIDIVIFSLDFAPKASGASVLQQIINSLPTIERRALFVIAIEDNSQTFNTHEAFLRNLNLIVNSNDLHHLPSILQRALHDYNDLYRNFNKALKLSNS
jgi:DNA-binding NtrC family response regulator